MQSQQDNDLSEFDVKGHYRKFGWWVQGLWVTRLHQMGNGGICLAGPNFSNFEYLLAVAYDCDIQDPDHSLIGEGNASGTLDPKLAVWTKQVSHNCVFSQVSTVRLIHCYFILKKKKEWNEMK